MKYLFTLLVLLPTLAFSQRNYKPGFVVTLKGDTLRGFIDYKEWNNNPGRVSFTADSNSPSQTYTPHTVNGFGVTGINNYQTYKGKISQDRADVSSVMQGVDSAYVIDTVFLRVVLKGKDVTLLHYKDAIKDRYFIAEKNGQPAELVYRVYVDNNNNGITEQFDTQYKKQLHALRVNYQPKNPELINAIQTTKYTEKDLYKIAEKINGGNISDQDVSASRSKLRVFIGAGINSSTTVLNPLIFGSTIAPNIVYNTSSVYTTPMINAGLDVILNKNTGKIIFRTELNFVANQARFNYLDNSLSGFPFTKVFMFDQKIISLTPQILYNFYKKEQLKLFAGLGLAVNYAIYSNNRYYYTSNSSPSDYGFGNVSPLFLNLAAKVGVLIVNNLEVNIGYIPSNTIIVGTAKMSSYRAGINYFFK